MCPAKPGNRLIRNGANSQKVELLLKMRERNFKLLSLIATSSDKRKHF